MMDTMPQQQSLASGVQMVLEPQEWNILLAGLGELPLKISKTLFEKIVANLQREQQRS